MSAFTVTISKYGHKLEVHGSASKFIPARTNCSNDDATPAEGGLEEVTEVYLLDVHGKRIELPDFLQEELEGRVIDNDDAAEEIAEALQESEYAGQEDRKEE